MSHFHLVIPITSFLYTFMTMPDSALSCHHLSVCNSCQFGVILQKKQLQGEVEKQQWGAKPFLTCTHLQKPIAKQNKFKLWWQGCVKVSHHCLLLTVFYIAPFARCYVAPVPFVVLKIRREEEGKGLTTKGCCVSCWDWVTKTGSTWSCPHHNQVGCVP